MLFQWFWRPEFKNFNFCMKSSLCNKMCPLSEKTHFLLKIIILHKKCTLRGNYINKSSWTPVFISIWERVLQKSTFPWNSNFLFKITTFYFKINFWTKNALLSTKHPPGVPLPRMLVNIMVFNDSGPQNLRNVLKAHIFRIFTKNMDFELSLAKFLHFH